jgi:hypothetical protein
VSQILALVLVALLHLVYLRVCLPFRMRIELAAGESTWLAVLAAGSGGGVSVCAENRRGRRCCNKTLYCQQQVSGHSQLGMLVRSVLLVPRLDLTSHSPGCRPARLASACPHVCLQRWLPACVMWPSLCAASSSSPSRTGPLAGGTTWG